MLVKIKQYNEFCLCEKDKDFLFSSRLAFLLADGFHYTSNEEKRKDKNGRCFMNLMSYIEKLK